MEQLMYKAIELDKKDPLKDFRERFVYDEDVIYLDGNSLGRLPGLTIDIMSDLVKTQWGERLIRSWNERWIELPRRIASKIASIVGAGADEVFVGDSTTVNLYKLAYASMAIRPARKKIVSDELNFPADLYILQGLVSQQFTGHYIELARSTDGVSFNEDQFSNLFDDQTSLAVLSHVAFRSSFMYDMHKINRMAHDKDIMVIWDLSHSTGAVPVELNKSNADMAVGCTYKYLNGGPGAPAFLYIRKDLQDKLCNPLTSWFSHKDPFQFDIEYQPDPSVQKFATGTPGILSMAAIEPGLDLFLEAGGESIREKSVMQTEFMLELISSMLVPSGFSVFSPPDYRKRGSHIAIKHAEAYRITRAMIEPAAASKIVIPDFRPPDSIRLGIAPLYTTFENLYSSVVRIKEIVDSREYERFGKSRLRVT